MTEELKVIISAQTDQIMSALEGVQGELEGLNKTTSLKTGAIKNTLSAWSVAIGNIISSAFKAVASTISQHLDAAISRVDTLSNYSIVMQNLGFSAEEASTAQQKLVDAIQGLPTTLPSIVATQQKYTALYGEIDKATEITIALNNATLAGGQGQEIASSAMEQWYQIIANGKPDLQSWKIIMQAMPAQLAQISQEILGTSATSNDLFQAWQDGTITTDQVTDAINKLNTEGGASFASFSDQALTANGGIETSMTNVKNKITTVLADIIQAAQDSGLDISGTFDNIKSMIAEVGDEIVNSIGEIDWEGIQSNIQNLLEKVSEALLRIDWEKLINGIISIISFIVPIITVIATNLDILIPVIIGISVAVKAFTVAQTMANLSLQACPITWIMDAIIALIAIIVIVIAYWDDIIAFIDGIWQKIKAFAVGIWDNTLKPLLDKFLESFSIVLNAAIDLFTNIISSIGAFFSNIWSSITGWFSNIINKVGSFAGNIVSKIGELPGKMLEIGINIVTGIWNGISSAASWLWSKITGWISGIWSGIKSFFGISSPSKLFAYAGEMLGEGLALGIDSKANEAVDSVKNMSSAIESAFAPELATPDFGMTDINQLSADIGNVGSIDVLHSISDTEYKNDNSTLLRDIANGVVNIANKDINLNVNSLISGIDRANLRAGKTVVSIGV